MRDPGKKIIVLNEVESTNNYAKQLILTNAEEGTVVLAQFQKKGRGQASNTWESEPGKNMLASIILYPLKLYASSQFIISKVVSLGLVDFLSEEVGDVSIKWPNDIYVGEKKIAGILIENTIKGNTLSSSVIGIGLNLNQEEFLSDAPNPVSLMQITGREYDVKEVTKSIVTNIIRRYDRVEKNDYAQIELQYYSKLFRREEWEVYSENGERFEAKIVGIGEFGQLRLQKRDESISEFMFKEVEFIV